MRRQLPLALLSVLLVLVTANFVISLARSSDDAASDPVPRAPATAAEPAANHDARGLRILDHAFSVTAGDLLKIRVSDASIQVEAADAPTAHVEVIVHGLDAAEARAHLEALGLTIQRDGRTVLVSERSRPPDARSAFGRRSPSVRVLARVPARFDLDLYTVDGDVTLEQAFEGTIRIRTADGDVRTATLKGETIELHTSDGDIRTRALASPRVHVQTADGDITLGEVSAHEITVRTADGDVRADALRTSAAESRIDVSTADGDLRLRLVDAPQTRLHTSDGDIVVDDLFGGRMTVQTADGDLTFGRIRGHLQATTSSGQIRGELTAVGDVSLRTTDGDVVLRLPAAHKADLRLRADDLRLDADLRFDGHLDDHQADGRLNGGGPLLEVRATSGRVMLRSR